MVSLRVADLWSRSSNLCVLWYIVGAVVGGSLLLVLFSLVLLRCGFFTRKDRDQVKILRNAVVKAAVLTSVAEVTSVVDPATSPEDISWDDYLTSLLVHQILARSKRVYQSHVTVQLLLNEYLRLQCYILMGNDRTGNFCHTRNKPNRIWTFCLPNWIEPNQCRAQRQKIWPFTIRTYQSSASVVKVFRISFHNLTLKGCCS